MPRRLPTRRFRAFDAVFPDEAACRAALAAARWPNGFICPKCGHDDAVYLAKRALRQCRACRRRTSVTAGTALHASKLPLRAWLFTVWRLGHQRGRVAATRLMRELGLGSYRTSWALLHKVRIALHEQPLAVQRETVELLYAALPDRVVGKTSSAGRFSAGLLVAATKNEARAAARPPPPVGRPSRAATPRANGVRARVVRTIDVVHKGVAATYLPAYVRALVFVHNRARVVAALRSAVVDALAGAPHASLARVRRLGVEGVLADSY